MRRLLSLLSLCLVLCQCSSGPKEWEYDFVPGKTAIIINDKAVPPADAPAPVLRAISAGNRICTKPYRRGGGHAHFEDSAYDCSGTVSYILHAAGKLDEPSFSGAFRKYEQVSDVYLTFEPFAMVNGLLTQSYKVKREFVAKRYHDELPQ